MYIAFKFYSVKKNNLENLPSIWLVEIVELSESTDLSEGFNTLMTLEDYQQYIVDNQYLMTPFDVIPASTIYKITNSQRDPSYIDYDILGLHKKKNNFKKCIKNRRIL